MGAAVSQLNPETRRFFSDVSAGHLEEVQHAVAAHPGLVKRRTALHSQSALHIAAQQGYEDMLRGLLQQARQLGQQMEAAAAAEPRTLGGAHSPLTADEFMRKVANAKNDRDQTPLMLAAAGGHESCVELLLAEGADPWAVDKLGGRSALHYAARIDSVPIIEALITAAGDSGPVEFPNRPGTKYVNIRSLCGVVPLHVAALFGSIGAIEALCRLGANLVSATLYDSHDFAAFRVGSTPLHLAANLGRTMACKALLKGYMESFNRAATPDPRLVLDGSGKVAATVAACSRRATSELIHVLRPTTPLVTIFGANELQLLGPPSLKVLASAALRGHLEAQLQAVERRLGGGAALRGGAAGGAGGGKGSASDLHLLACKQIEQQGQAVARSNTSRACASGAGGAARCGGGGSCSGGPLQEPGVPAVTPVACTTPGQFASGELGMPALCSCDTCDMLRPDAGRVGDAAKLLMGGWSGVQDADWDADDDASCGVCLDEPPLVRLAPCQHTLCAGCCRALFSMEYKELVTCPFCRANVGGFEAATGR